MRFLVFFLNDTIVNVDLYFFGFMYFIQQYVYNTLHTHTHTRYN